jgi:hypothetical protein
MLAAAITCVAVWFWVLPAKGGALGIDSAMSEIHRSDPDQPNPNRPTESTAQFDRVLVESSPAKTTQDSSVFRVERQDGSPVMGAEVLGARAGERLITGAADRRLGETNQEGQLECRVAEDYHAFVCRANHGLFAFKEQSDATFLAVVREQPTFVAICRTPNGEPLEGVTVTMSLTELPANPIGEVGIPNTTRPRNAIYGAVTGQLGEARVKVSESGQYMIDLYKEGFVVMKGVDPLWGGVNTEEPRVEVTMAPVCAVAWEAPDDELLTYRVHAPRDAWSQSMVRDLERQRVAVLRRFGPNVHCSVHVPPNGGELAFRGEFFLRHSGWQTVSGTAVPVSALIAPLQLKGRNGNDRACQVVVRVIDAEGVECPSVAVLLGGRGSPSRHHALSGDVVVVPPGRYSVGLSSQVGLEVIGGKRWVDALEGGKLECVLTLAVAVVQCRVKVVASDGVLAHSGRYQLRFDAGTDGTVICSGDGWRPRLMPIPIGHVRVSGGVGGVSIEQQVDVQRPASVPLEVSVSIDA